MGKGKGGSGRSFTLGEKKKKKDLRRGTKEEAVEWRNKREKGGVKGETSFSI